MVKVCPDFWAVILASGSRSDHVASLWTWKIWLPTCFQTGMLFLQFLLAVSGPAGWFWLRSTQTRVVSLRHMSRASGWKSEKLNGGSLFPSEFLSAVSAGIMSECVTISVCERVFLLLCRPGAMWGCFYCQMIAQRLRLYDSGGRATQSVSVLGLWVCDAWLTSTPRAERNSHRSAAAAARCACRGFDEAVRAETRSWITPTPSRSFCCQLDTTSEAPTAERVTLGGRICVSQVISGYKRLEFHREASFMLWTCHTSPLWWIKSPRHQRLQWLIQNILQK